VEKIRAGKSTPWGIHKILNQRNNRQQHAAARNAANERSLRWSRDFLSEHLMSVAREKRQREAELATKAALLNEASYVLMDDGCWADADKTLRERSTVLLAKLEAKDTAGAQEAFKAITQACAACHKAPKIALDKVQAQFDKGDGFERAATMKHLRSFFEELHVAVGNKPQTTSHYSSIGPVFSETARLPNGFIGWGVSATGSP